MFYRPRSKNCYGVRVNENQKKRKNLVPGVDELGTISVKYSHRRTADKKRDKIKGIAMRYLFLTKKRKRDCAHDKHAIFSVMSSPD